MSKFKTILAAALCGAMPIASGLAAAQPAAPAPASAAPKAGAQPIGSSWGDIAKMPDFFTGNWQSVTSFLDKANGTPLTPKAKEHADKFKVMEDIPFAGAGCPTPGMPIVQRLGSPLKFFYEPGMIAIYVENSSISRFLRLNGKKPEQTNPTYMGTSVAHFEGDTLVVESTDFADDVLTQYTNFEGKGTGFLVLPPDSIFGPHGPNMRMVERIKLVDPDTLLIDLTIYDDTIWTKPYKADPQTFKRNRGDAGWPNEWVCGSTADPVEFDANSNETVMEDPAAVLKKLRENEQN